MKKVFFFALAFMTIFLQTAATAKERGSITVEISQTKEITPDIGRITIEVQTSDKILKKATEENNRITQNIYNKLSAAIDSNRGDYIKTATYKVNPIYTYPNNKKTFDKYSVTNSVTVKVHDTKAISALVDMATANGATNIGGLDFSLSNYDKDCRELLITSVQKAKVQAKVLAEASDTRLNGLKSLNTECSAVNDYRNYGFTMAKSFDSNDESTAPIESGKITIKTTVNAEFFVK